MISQLTVCSIHVLWNFCIQISNYQVVLHVHIFKMYEPTLKNLTNLDYGKPPKYQNQVSY